MYLISFRADQHHANSRAILILGTVNIDDPLFHVFLINYRVLIISCLNHFRCLSIVHHSSYFGCISVGESYYKVGKGSPFNYRSRVIAYIE